jgi:hypothetical protein
MKVGIADEMVLHPRMNDANASWLVRESILKYQGSEESRTGTMIAVIWRDERNVPQFGVLVDPGEDLVLITTPEVALEAVKAVATRTPRPLPAFAMN